MSKNVQKVQIVSDLTKSGSPRKRRKKKDWLENRLVQFIDKLTVDDVIKLSIFSMTTFTIHEISPGVISGPATRSETITKAEAIAWFLSALVAYGLVYRPEAVAATIEALIPG